MGLRLLLREGTDSKALLSEKSTLLALLSTLIVLPLQE